MDRKETKDVNGEREEVHGTPHRKRRGAKTKRRLESRSSAMVSNVLRAKIAELNPDKVKAYQERRALVLQGAMSSPFAKSSASSHLENPLKSLKPFKFSRKIAHMSALVNSAGGTGYGRKFELDEIPDFAEMTALFDQYRFTKITLHCYPRCNVNSLTTMAVVTTLTCSLVAVTVDPDDATAPTSFDQVLAYPTSRVHNQFEPFSYAFIPRAAVAAYGGAFTAFADFDGWLDCASDDIQYYALKAYSVGDGASQTTHQIFDFIFDVEMEFRAVH